MKKAEVLTASRWSAIRSAYSIRREVRTERSRLDESSARYPSASCSSAELASVSLAIAILLNRNPAVQHFFHCSANLSKLVSHVRGQAQKMFINVLLFVMLQLDGVQHNSGDNVLEATIRTVLTTGALEGQRDKQIIRGGDAVAVAVTKIIGDKDLSDQDIGITLDTINMSFSDVRQISKADDREARSALLVLKYLNLIARDSATKARISKTKETILNATSQVPK